MNRPFKRRGNLVRPDGKEQTPSAYDGRHPDSLRGLGRVRPGSAPTPEQLGSHDHGEPENISALGASGIGAYTGPSFAAATYGTDGLIDESRPEERRDWEKGYAPDDPEVLRKLFNIRISE